MTDFKTLFAKTNDLTLLLVEDSEPLHNELAEVLENLFKTVVVASNDLEGLGLYDEYYKENDVDFDIVIIDVVTPRMIGLDLFEILKKRNKDQQIIIVAKETDCDYLHKLIDFGIVHLLNKPIDQNILFDTLLDVSGKIIKKDTTLDESSMVRLGKNIFWNKSRNILIHNNVPVTLTRYELLFMQLFVEKMEQICTCQDILHHFDLEGIDLDEKNIRNMIFKLRKKLPDASIESVYGMGYKLIPIIENKK
ncbi:two component transcriptional regulator, winged helix family [hydrothermal vent metagenome]|uniref:Two component transcriptional regulator, winged helix family n=1 Tax=hydrothermal vent metagenome TaxID=652676 RepID=A0A1W1EEA9_9ZZZZ